MAAHRITALRAVRVLSDCPGVDAGVLEGRFLPVLRGLMGQVLGAGLGVECRLSLCQLLFSYCCP